MFTCPFRYVNMHKFMRLCKNPSRIVDMMMEAANIQVCMQLLRVDFSMTSLYTQPINKPVANN